MPWIWGYATLDHPHQLKDDEVVVRVDEDDFIISISEFKRADRPYIQEDSARVRISAGGYARVDRYRFDKRQWRCLRRQSGRRLAQWNASPEGVAWKKGQDDFIAKICQGLGVSRDDLLNMKEVKNDPAT